MKKTTKFISLILTVLLIISMAVPAFSAFAASENIPTVFVGGRGTTLIDKDGKTIYPTNLDTMNYIKEKSKEILPLLAIAVLTDDYDEYCDALYEAVADIYKDLKLNEDGEADNGSRSPFSWSKQQLEKKVKAPGEPYGMYDFTFYYDWRLDPVFTASELRDYINDVLEVTGASKINIIGRCYGGNVVCAYMTEYGCEKIEKCILYATTANGSSMCGALFSGRLELSGDSLSRYLSDFLEDDYLNNFIMTTVDLYNSQTGMKLPISALKALYSKIANNIVPRLVISSYGSFPSYWAMIDDEYYEDAKKMVFGGQEEKYAKFIEKIDYYHENIMNPLCDNLISFEQQGADFYVIAKYGKQLVPITDQPDLLGDNTVEVVAASFGATCCEVNQTFDDNYIEKRIDEGLGGYISPDKQIDASTCLFRDYTWFIKNSEHSDFIGAIDDLMTTILRYNGRMSVNDNKNYPQFMVQSSDGNAIFPMTDENANTTADWNPDKTNSFIRFIFSIIELIVNLITKWIAS